MPADTLVVREATLDDAHRVSVLATKLSHREKLDQEAFAVAFAEALADSPRTLLHIAEIDGDIVGYALTTINTLLYTNGPSAQLQEIVVDDSQVTTGVGTALVRAVEDACTSSGVVQLTVASRRAGGFYDRLGYTQQAEYLRRAF